MVTGIFCHYLPIYKDINGVYCSTTLTDAMFDRYFSVVDKLLVATRVYPIDTTFSEMHQEKIDLTNIEIVEFPNLSDPKVMLTSARKEKAKLTEAIKKADLIFVRGGVIANWGADIARKLNKPYLDEVAGCAWDEYWNYSGIGKLLAPYMEIKAKSSVRKADYAVYVTEQWLQNRYPTKGISTHASNVILSNIDENALAARLEKIASLRKERQIVLGTTGGVGNKAKGQQFVIEAMQRLRNRYDFRYELVGSGDNSYLKGKAKQAGLGDKVVFKGQLTHEEVLFWLDSIDIYIQPSMQEGLPRSLIEAMSRACPAIGSTTAGIPELLETECIFRRGNTDALCKVLDSFMISDWLKYANRNFEKSKEFEIRTLTERRNILFRQYRDAVVGSIE